MQRGRDCQKRTAEEQAGQCGCGGAGRATLDAAGIGA